jgi:hypothetical protein
MPTKEGHMTRLFKIVVAEHPMTDDGQPRKLGMQQLHQVKGHWIRIDSKKGRLFVHSEGHLDLAQFDARRVLSVSWEQLPQTADEVAAAKPKTRLQAKKPKAKKKAAKKKAAKKK